MSLQLDQNDMFMNSNRLYLFAMSTLCMLNIAGMLSTSVSALIGMNERILNGCPQAKSSPATILV